MIAYIEGHYEFVTEQSVVIESGGIGYEILVPQTVFFRLPASGERIRLYTHLQVREDGLSLFGFLTKDDLKIFKLLITVSGIGPKGALSVLSVLTGDQIRFAVLAEDVKTISMAPGIGKKTAGKLILELKDKLHLQDIQSIGIQEVQLDPLEAASDSVQQEAIQALVALGYSATEAMQAVKSAGYVAGMTSEELLKKSLKKIF